MPNDQKPDSTAQATLRALQQPDLSGMVRVEPPSTYSRPMFVPPLNDQPGWNPLQRGPLPPCMNTAPDQLRQFYNRNSGPQHRVLPQQPAGVAGVNSAAASQVINITGTSKGVTLQTNNVQNANQALLNLIAGSGVTLSANALGAVTISGGGGDGLTHGDSIWDIDPAWNGFKDDFYGPLNASNQGNGGISLGWSFANSTGTLFSQHGQGPQHRGEIGWVIASPTADAANVLLFSNFPNGASLGSQNQSALLENPGWKLIWVFRLTKALNTVIAFSPMDLTNRSLYVGLITNLSSVSLAGRPASFIGLRYDTDTTSPSIGDTTFHFEVVENSFGSATGTLARNNAQGSTFDTGVVPVEDAYYRLEIKCVSVGVVTMSLNGSAPQTFTAPQYSIASGSGAATGRANGTDTMALNMGQDLPFAPASSIAVSGATGGDSPFNGTWIPNQMDTQQMARFYSGASIGNHNLTGVITATGYPGYHVGAMFSNSKTGTASTSTTAILFDMCSFLWNPAVNPSNSLTPNPLKPRYW
jgi:hypothetical protein